ncbi:MAG: type II toxin-antitoxin system RelE/ParE family toxin [Paludibacter sp.]|nr:type II toxin-antitoxin system RelE/ParE family toxin [Paludibacter sp.]
MIISFEKEYLRDLYEKGKTNDKKHRYQPEVVRKYKHCIDILFDISGIEVLYKINSLNYEVLKGDKAGISSIRVNKQYRIEFKISNKGVEPVVTVCNIFELSNHYK